MMRVSAGRSICLAVVLSVVVVGCEQVDEPTPDKKPSAPEPQILEFPAEFHAEDEAVNAFVREVIDTCASGNYEAFRELWSIRDDPFPRDQFHKAWQSVQKVRIRGLRQVLNPADGKILYAVRAIVELDPSVRDPERDVIIVLIEEAGRWRMTSAPESLPDGFFETAPPTTQPQGASTPSAENP